MRRLSSPSSVCVEVSELGGIPVMLRAADMSNTIPDEKVVITSLSVSVLRCQSWEVFL